MVSRKKLLVNAWRAKGGVYDLIELDNGDLVAAANLGSENYISIYRYDDDKDEYISFKDIESDDSMITSLVKLENNKFISGSMDNTIKFWTEKDGSYVNEKEVELKETEKYDCIYSLKINYLMEII